MTQVKREWSKYQQDVFEDVMRGSGHTVVIARAGSGKTTTIVEAFKYVPKKLKTLMVAFNKKIAEELKERAPSYIDVMTLHSLGFKAVKTAFGQSCALDPDKTLNLVQTLLTEKGIR
jgi:superfamily I DNA/RNA helicase